MGSARLSGPSVLRTDLPSCSMVTGFYVMVVKIQVLRYKGISELVIPVILKAR